jgi:Flp pilus assembly protein TadB
MPGIPSNVPILPPFWRASSCDNFNLGFFAFLALMFLLVASIMLAWEGDLLMSASVALILAMSILAIWWFKLRIRREQPPADEQ